MRLKDHFKWGAWDKATLQDRDVNYVRPSPPSSPRAELGVLTDGWKKEKTRYGRNYLAPEGDSILLVRAETRDQYRARVFVFQGDNSVDIEEDQQEQKVEDISTKEELGIWGQRQLVEVFFRQMPSAPSEPKSLVLWDSNLALSESSKNRQLAVSTFLQDNGVIEEIALNVGKYLEQEQQKRAEKIAARQQEDAEVSFDKSSRGLRKPIAPIKEDEANGHAVRESSRRVRMMQNAQGQDVGRRY